MVAGVVAGAGLWWSKEHVLQELAEGLLLNESREERRATVVPVATIYDRLRLPLAARQHTAFDHRASAFRQQSGLQGQ